MPAFSSEQWIVVGLVLLIGIVIGAMMASGGKWKKRYREEHARANALESGQEARVSAANARIAELERNQGQTAAIGAGTGAAIAGATKGNDRLDRIRGIDSTTEVRLNELGFHRYKQIAKLSDAEAARIEGDLGAEPGRIDRDSWREQAELLAGGKDEEHGRLYV